MFKLTRKALSLVLTMVLTLSFGTVAFADGGGKQIPPTSLGQHQTIDANGDAVFAIKNNGELWAVTDTTSMKVLDGCVSVNTAAYQAFAVKEDGTVWKLGKDDSFTAQQVLTGLPKIALVHAAYSEFGSVYQLYALTENGVLYSYDYFNDTPVVELMADVNSISGQTEMYALKNDNTLWRWSDSEPTPILVVDGAQEIIEGKFTNIAETTRSKGSIVGSDYYIDENNVLQFDGRQFDEASSEFFDGLGRKEVATDVAAFVITGELTVLKTDGTLWGNAYIEWGELYDGELQELLTDVRLPGADGQNVPQSLPEINQNIPSAWAAENIETAKSLGLTTVDLTNDYQAATTRAEFCRAAVNFLRKYGYDVDSVTAKTFADTSDKDIGIAAALGITSGTDTANNLFSPDTQLTREQAATMLCAVLDVIGVSYESAPVAWTDKADMSTWAAEGVDVMYSAKIMGGTSATELVFGPKSPYTHEQSIVTLLKLSDYAKAQGQQTLTHLIPEQTGALEVSDSQTSFEMVLEDKLSVPELSFATLDCKATLETYRKAVLNRPDFAFLAEYLPVVYGQYVGSFSLMQSDKTVDYNDSQAVSERRDNYNAMIKRFADGISRDISEAERVKAVYECIGENSSYILETLHGTQCQTISETFNALAWSVGIESINVEVAPEEGGGHAWNMVRVGDNWYHVDVTWDYVNMDLQTIQQRNFMLSDEGIRKTGHDFGLPDVPWEMQVLYGIADEYYNSRLQPPEATDKRYENIY